MRKFLARLKYRFTGKHDPMDLLNGVYPANLPKHLSLSKGMLKSKELAYEAGDLVATLYRTNEDNDFSFAQKLRDLPKHWGTLGSLMYYDAMVINGGHDQYFSNTEGAYLDLVENGLALYANDYHMVIFQRALYRYNPDLYAKHADLDPDRPSEEASWRSFYEDLDGLYFEAEPKLPHLVENYIRSHIELYQS